MGTDWYDRKAHRRKKQQPILDEDIKKGHSSKAKQKTVILWCYRRTWKSYFSGPPPTYAWQREGKYLSYMAAAEAVKAKIKNGSAFYRRSWFWIGEKPDE